MQISTYIIVEYIKWENGWCGFERANYFIDF